MLNDKNVKLANLSVNDLNKIKKLEQDLNNKYIIIAYNK